MQPQKKQIELRGLACVPGVVRGPLWIVPGISGGKSSSACRDGCIWAIDGPLSAGSVIEAIGHAVGIVARSGGFTSHGANLAREAGLPTVSAIADFAVLRRARSCVLDGDLGILYLELD